MKNNKNKILFWRSLQFWANIIAFLSLIATVSYSFYFSQKMALINDRNTIVSLFMNLLDKSKQIQVIKNDYNKNPISFDVYSSRVAITHEEIKLILSEIENIQKSINPKITYLQFRILAESYEIVNDYKKELFYWEKAINAPNTPNNIKIELLRACAGCYYKNGIKDKGVELYQKALDINSDTSELGRYFDGVTYCSWAQEEINYNNGEQAKKLLAEALKIFIKIQNYSMRSSGVEQVNLLLKRIKKTNNNTDVNIL